MKLLKKWTTLTLSATLFTATVFGLSTPPAAAQGGADTIVNEETMYYFPVDVEGHWAAERLNDFVYSDIIRGYVTTDPSTGVEQVEVRPNNPITRAEFVTLLVRSLGLSSTATAQNFVDVKPGSWYYEPIRIASSLGIVNGLEANQFAPTRPIKRDEIATLVVRAFDKTINFTTGQPKPFTDVPSYWATPYINNASGVGIINGYTGGLFKPTANATRAEAVTMLYNSLRKETNALPADVDLTRIVLSSVNESAAVMSSGTYTGLVDVAKKYHTASDQVMMSSLNEALTSAIPSNVTLKITPQDLSTQVTQKSDRFATITLAGSMEVVAKIPDTAITRKEDAASTYYLRKVPGDNTWKIYHSTSTATGGGMFPF